MFVNMHFGNWYRLRAEKISALLEVLLYVRPDTIYEVLCKISEGLEIFDINHQDITWTNTKPNLSHFIDDRTKQTAPNSRPK